MRLALRAHADFPAASVTAIETEVEREGSALSLRYRLTGAIGALAIPSITAPERADELWRHTCFEAFLKPDAGPRYIELNFAPSTQWAAYRFNGYREGMRPAAIAAPRIAVTASDTNLDVAVSLDLASLDLPPGPYRLALSAVIEAAGGAKSYWALAHAVGRPDFHHDAGFASMLPA
jgi:hypothetical protein